MQARVGIASMGMASIEHLWAWPSVDKACVCVCLHAARQLLRFAVTKHLNCSIACGFECVLKAEKKLSVSKKISKTYTYFKILYSIFSVRVAE